jgi:hypothetical protein
LQSWLQLQRLKQLSPINQMWTGKNSEYKQIV